MSFVNSNPPSAEETCVAAAELVETIDTTLSEQESDATLTLTIEVAEVAQQIIEGK